MFSVTAIAALAHRGKVYVAGDSAGVGPGWSLVLRADSKVFTNGPFVMGFTTSFRMGQLLRYSFQPPDHRADVETYRYMATAFVDAVRDCLKAGGYATKNSEQETGGTFVVGYRGRVFVIESDYQVAEPMDGYAAVGCGSDQALGSLFTSTGDPKHRLRTAIAAAERFSAGVRGPVVIEREP